MKQFKVSNEIYTDRNRNVNHYFEDVSGKEMLTADQENELAKKIKKGCEKSKERLIEANLRFVISVAKSYHKRGSILSLEDLINSTWHPVNSIGVETAFEASGSKQGQSALLQDNFIHGLLYL